MKTNFLKNLLIILISMYFSTGCIFNTRENINKLPDKKFYFAEFQYILPGQTQESAVKFFKQFPVKKIMFMLAQEYNIVIDISDFNHFIKTAEPAELKADGALRISKHTWSKAQEEKNRIIFVFEQDYFDSSILKFKLGLYSGYSTLKLFNTEINTTEYIITNLKKNLEKGENSFKEYEEKNYDNISPVPGIVDTKSDPEKISAPDDSNII